MEYSDSGLALTAHFEGLRLAAYQDGAGVWTIGYGHTDGVHKGMTCTAEQALEWLREDVRDAESAVRRLVIVTLNQMQYDALVDFVFNLGAGAFERSTLLKKLNVGDYAGAAAQFKLWNLVDGAPSLGLTRRRAAEADLFSGKAWRA